MWNENFPTLSGQRCQLKCNDSLKIYMLLHSTSYKSVEKLDRRLMKCMSPRGRDISTCVICQFNNMSIQFAFNKFVESCGE